MKPTVAVVGTLAAENGAAHMFPHPSVAREGDYLVAILRAQGSNWPADWGLPSGFERHGPAFVPNSQGRVNGIYVKRVGETSPSSYEFTATPNSRRVGLFLLISNTVGPAGASDNWGVSTPALAAQYSTADQNGEPGLTVFTGASEFAGSATNAPTSLPAGYAPLKVIRTPDDDSVSRTYLWVGTADHAAGATVPQAGIEWAGGVGAHAESITFQGGPPAPLAPLALDGTGEPVEVFYTEGDTMKPALALYPMPHGYPSVQGMLAGGEFFWAHRGGSASNPEHSLFAYTQAVRRGFGGLEASLARTADGVWFGLHDQTIARTSSLTEARAASQMTWAEVQEYQITRGPGGAQPYMRLQDLLEAYGRSHVLILDPKYAHPLLGQVLDIAADFYGGDQKASERVIAKAFGVGGKQFSLTARARGYMTWGYFYDSDSGQFAEHAPDWDLLGLDFEAPLETWNALRAAAPGRPVVAHICPSDSAVAQGRSKGASGFQCSSIAITN